MSVRKPVCLFIVAHLAAWALGAQAVSLGEFNLGTTGYFPSGSGTPSFSMDGALAVRFLPVGWLRFGTRFAVQTADAVDFLSAFADSRESAELYFDGVSVELHEPGGRPFSLTAFSGSLDDPVSGSLLRDTLKAELAEPEFYGSTPGKAFSPDTGINGTGAAFTCAPTGQSAALGVYGYWNGRLDAHSRVTWDFRLAGAGNALAYNAFFGVSQDPGAAETNLRGGVTALLGTGDRNSLYLSAGLRSFVPGSSDARRNLYFLFEPRISAGSADLAFAFFSSPLFPENVPDYLSVDAESDYLGSNVRVSFGDLDRDRMRGGLNLLGTINPEQPSALTPFSFSVSPYFSVRVSDFVFGLTAAIKPLLFDDPLRMGEVRLSVKAVY